jgi:hypothetical protein
MPAPVAQPTPVESVAAETSEAWSLVDTYKLRLRRTSKWGIVGGAIGLLGSTLFLAWWLAQPVSGSILARGSSYGRSGYPLMELAAQIACVIVSAVCLFLSVRLRRRVIEGNPAHVTRVLRAVRTALLILLYLLFTGTILVPTLMAPAMLLVVGLACCTATGLLLNATRRTLHALAPPRASRGNKLGFPVLLAGGAHADAVTDTPARIDTPDQAAAPLQVLPLGEEITMQPGVADMETLVRAFAAAGLVAYGGVLAVIFVLTAVWANWALIADGNLYSRAITCGIGMITVCAIFWVVWGVLCIGGGLRWHRLVRAVAWVSPCAFTFTAIVVITHFGAQFTEDGISGRDNDFLYLIVTCVPVLLHPFLLLLLVTRPTVTELFARDRSHTLSPEITGRG